MSLDSTMAYEKEIPKSRKLPRQTTRIRFRLPTLLFAVSIIMRIVPVDGSGTQDEIAALKMMPEISCGGPKRIVGGFAQGDFFAKIQISKEFMFKLTQKNGTKTIIDLNKEVLSVDLIYEHTTEPGTSLITKWLLFKFHQETKLIKADIRIWITPGRAEEFYVRCDKIVKLNNTKCPKDVQILALRRRIVEWQTYFKHAEETLQNRIQTLRLELKVAKIGNHNTNRKGYGKFELNTDAARLWRHGQPGSTSAGAGSTTRTAHGSPRSSRKRRGTGSSTPTCYTAATATTNSSNGARASGKDDTNTIGNKMR